jgi:hypothetical protein
MIVPKSESSEIQIPTRLICLSASDVAEALEAVEHLPSYVMILVHCDPETGQPCITRSVLSTICKHFNLTPSFATYLEGHPGFHQHLMQPEQQSKIRPGKATPRDFCYAVPFPWSRTNEDVSFKQSELHTVSNYTRIGQEGVPEVTIFVNVTESHSESLRFGWMKGLTGVHSDYSASLQNHFLLFSIALHELQNQLGVLETLHAYFGDSRVEMHLESGAGDTDISFSKSRKFLGQLHFISLSIGNCEHIIKALEKTAHHSAMIQQDFHTCFQEEQMTLWAEDLVRGFSMVRSRVVEIIARQRTAEEMISAVTALRDSRTLSRNTEEMTLMARATEKSGLEAAAMARRMENDARLMKFLAEITAFFLPITAIATVFSMDFFSITATPKGPLPTFDNIRYSWIYFAFASPVSLGVFVWWAYKRYDMHSRTGAHADLGNEAAEVSMALQKDTEGSRRKQFAKEMKREIESRFIDLDARKPLESDEDASEAWHREHGRLLARLFLANRVAETGEYLPEFFEEEEGASE